MIMIMHLANQCMKSAHDHDHRHDMQLANQRIVTHACFSEVPHIVCIQLASTGPARVASVYGHTLN